MLDIPLQPVPAQVSHVILDNQNFDIAIYQKSTGVFVDVAINGESIVSGVLARDITPIICRDYLGFSGNLIFIDTQGNDDPDFSGFATRWHLIYLTAGEYALIRQ